VNLEKITKLFSKKNTAKKQSSAPPKMNSNAVNFDLLYQLSYMSVIAASGVPRARIFERSAQISCASAEYFRRVELTCRRLRYDYAKACRIVGESAKEETMKGLLLRFTSSLISGEPERDFLTREAEAQAEAYDNEYGRKLETLKLWTDAYVSLILSAVLVVIVGIVSTMIWKVETLFIVGLVAISILVTVIGIWLIYAMSPREYSVLGKAGSNEQKLACKLFIMLTPIALTVSAVVMAFVDELGWAMLAGSALILPVGLVSIIDDKKVTSRDSEIGAFLGSLGGVCAATGATVREALGRLDLDAINHLQNEVKRLYTRFNSGIRSRLCWDKFIEETGSEIANRSVGMFYDAVELGGEPEQAGYYASLFANKISQLRARRKTVSVPFTWLCITMHGAIITLLIFITEIITIFGDMIRQASDSMPSISGAPSVGTFSSFNFSGLEMLHSMVLPLVCVFTVANAVAPFIADGGSRYKILFNLAITGAISGTCLIFLPKIADSLFSTIQI